MSATASIAPHLNSGPARSYVSILFGHEPDATSADPPDYLTDLNLDRLIDSVLVGRGEYDLAGVFSRRLSHPDDVAYQQAVLRDLEHPVLALAVTRFAERLPTMRGQLER